MDSDLTVMIYGVIMGVAGSILTSIISALFQFWLPRREHERRPARLPCLRLLEACSSNKPMTPGWDLLLRRCLASF